jgi:hydrogenase/urease accessory protein HupE
LSLGFFGFAPAAAWFVPAVETGIALSIIYVAVVAVLPDLNPRFSSERSEWAVICITGLIGLLHGLGFSFVLQNILQVTSPNIWQSLLAFNLGVEVGQVFIVLLTLLFFYPIGRISIPALQVSRYLTAGGCAAISLLWVVERTSNIVSNV